MARVCSVCSHPQRPEIDRAIAADHAPNRLIAARYDLEYSSVHRHKQAGHVAEALAVYDAETLPFRIDTAALFARNVEVLEKALNAADEWLTDPERPDHYYLGPRSTEVDVVYEDYADLTEQGKPRRKRASLQELLRRIEQAEQVGVLRIHEKFSDPRDYLLKSTSERREDLRLLMESIALMEEKRLRELAEQKVRQQEQASVAEMFEQRRDLAVDELAAALMEEGADEERARDAAGRMADRVLGVLVASFQGDEE